MLLSTAVAWASTIASVGSCTCSTLPRRARHMLSEEEAEMWRLWSRRLSTAACRHPHDHLLRAAAPKRRRRVRLARTPAAAPPPACTRPCGRAPCVATSLQARPPRLLPTPPPLPARPRRRAPLFVRPRRWPPCRPLCSSHAEGVGPEQGGGSSAEKTGRRSGYRQRRVEEGSRSLQAG